MGIVLTSGVCIISNSGMFVKIWFAHLNQLLLRYLLEECMKIEFGEEIFTKPV